MSFEDVLQYLVAPPDLFQEREGSVTQDNSELTDDLIMKEALDLQTSNLSVNTKNQYKTHLRKYLVRTMYACICGWQINQHNNLKVALIVVFRFPSSKKFCNNLAPNNAHGEGGRASLYDVSEVKALRFFREVMFKSTTKKYFDTKQSRDVRTPYMFKSTNTKDHIPTLSQSKH